MSPRSSNRVGIFWFRDDLRLDDNPALRLAAEESDRLVLVFVHEPDQIGYRSPGGAARWWLHQSLASLAGNLRSKGQRLVLAQGSGTDTLLRIARETAATAVYWNRRYGPAAELDKDTEQKLRSSGVPVKVRSCTLLFEPEAVLEGRDGPFKVYSAFWKSTLRRLRPRAPVPAPASLPPPPAGICSTELKDLNLAPKAPDWSGGLQRSWSPGPDGASVALSEFVSSNLADYPRQRDVPSIQGTSRLSPHLRFGEVSVARIWDALEGVDTDATKFKAELGWREFAYHTLSAFPQMALDNLRPDFDGFPWRQITEKERDAWRKGQTGIPIVDAGMRELWETGWMHNRVRMITASLLTKNLLSDWRSGEAWFWDTLVDADPANNPFGWQWVAGSGFDAQPFFRIFNPVLQGQRFDSAGDYVRRWVPEIANLPNSFIHSPWTASPLELAGAGLRLGESYPLPIVNLKETRRRALDAFAALKAK